MSSLRPVAVDFETAGFKRRPDYPPIPVGFSLLKPGERKTTYYAWGHPTENNCSKAEAVRALKSVWYSSSPLVFHNAKFDVDVAETHLGLRLPDWERIHDTMFLVFLDDPHAASHGLKQSAERVLGMAPEERDAVKEWILSHAVEIYQHTGERVTAKSWGAFIAHAPGKLVGTYANGDVIRTLRLFNKLWPDIRRRGMLEAYDRERELMPLLLQNEREGIRVDVHNLRKDLNEYQLAHKRCDEWLRKRLRAPELNVDSDEELVEALDRSGVVTEWALTETGRRSTSKKNMTVDTFKDKRVASVLGYRNRLSTCMGTFMSPWLDTAERSNGLIFTNWNQCKQYGNEGDKGARTGRMSTNPNFQNVPKSFDDKDDGYVHPTVIQVPELPLMRKYLLPDSKEVFLHRDYNQQELRILAHFEDGSLLQAYIDNPRLDVHDFVMNEIKKLFGLSLERRSVKILNFGMLYGMGMAKLAIGVHSTVEEARRLKNAQLAAIPGLKDLDKSIKERGKAGEPIYTWGGREYYAEPPAMIDGHMRTFEYKLLNYLIQGSAADCTKQAVINYHKLRKHGRFLVTVHDEINISAPRAAAKEEMRLLREAMESVKFDVPMLSDGKIGPNWGSLKKFKEAA